MKTINVPTREQLSPASQLLYDQVKAKLGKVPNLYATIGYSPKALEAYLYFDQVLNQGILTEKEREAIALTVSETNCCNYCLAAHTLTSSMKGISKEETFSFRKGEAGDPKLNSLVKLAKSIAVNNGNPDPKLLEEFFNAGYNETALMELVGLVTSRIFTNYVYSLTDIPIDFPVAEALT